MKKSEEIKKIIESVSQEDIKRKIKNRQVFIIGDVYKIHGPIVNIDKKEIKIDALEKIIGDSKKLEKIKENIIEIIHSDEKKKKELSNFSPEKQEMYITDTVSATASVVTALPHQDQYNFLERGVVLPESPAIISQEIRDIKPGIIKFSKKGDNITINQYNIPTNQKEKWYKTWWGTIIIGLIITIIGGLALYYLTK
jgi:hypothetical protein